MTSINDHVRYLGIATIVYHALSLVVLLVIVPLVIGGSIFAIGESPELGGLIGGIGGTIILILLALALPGILGGWGLLKRKSWAKPLTIVANILPLFSFPIGTALGVYTFWVLIKEDADAVLA